jgi:hypothetical protein
MSEPITNEKGRPMYELLRSVNIPVQAVAILGVFVHVQCQSHDTAAKAARFMQKGGAFKLLKITHWVDKAKHANDAKSACGLTTWVDRYTAHLKVC